MLVLFEHLNNRVPELIINDELFRNKVGVVKLQLVKNVFDNRLTPDDINLIKDLYTEWRDCLELMPMRLTWRENICVDATELNTTAELYTRFLDNHGRESTYYKDYVFFDKDSMQWLLKPSCKRGNDVYIKMFKQRYNKYFHQLKKMNFFTTIINRSRKRVRKTKLLYVTGTVAQKFCANCGSPVELKSNICEHCGNYVFNPLDLSEAWINFGKYWNSFITNIRQQFNGAEFFRVWQSQENGFPHFHALIYFPNFKFTAMHWIEKDGSESWRIHNRQKHNGKLVRDRIKDSWTMGFLDIKCCDSLKKAKTDLLKYIIRDLKGGESNLTNALIWFYRKQSFAVSQSVYKKDENGNKIKDENGNYIFIKKGFFDSLGAKTNIAMAEPCNDDLINAEGVIQRNNSNKTLIRIEVFPLIRHDILDFSYTKDILDLAKTPDPPPKIVEFLENYADTCKPSTFRIDSNGVEIVVYKNVY